MKKAISYLFIFLGIYILLGAIVTMVWEFVTGSTDLVTGKLITTTAVTSVVVIAVFLLTRWAEVSPKWIRTRPWMVLFWSVVASLGALIPSAWVQE